LGKGKLQQLPHCTQQESTGTGHSELPAFLQYPIFNRLREAQLRLERGKIHSDFSFRAVSGVWKVKTTMAF